MLSASSALYKCVKENDTSLFAELLYRRGKEADINHQDKAGRTMLKVACENGNVEISGLLVAAKCNINLVDNVGESPLYAACCSNTLEIIQLLINEDVELNTTNQEGATALYISALNGNLEALFMLLEAGADVSIADNNGATPLHMVSEHTANIDAARLLIDAGADVNALNKYGWSPLHDAAQECNVLAVGYLIECGADVNIADKDGWTPLYIAAQNGHVAVVKALIKLGGAKVDIVDHEGCTALIVASRYGQTAVAEILLLAGADYFVRNAKGKRARDVAAVPHLRKLFKHFDMCIAAARLYTRHHQPSAVASQAAIVAAAAAAAVAAAATATSTSARQTEDRETQEDRDPHGRDSAEGDKEQCESSETDDVLLASVGKPTPAKNAGGGRYFQHTPFSPGSSLSFPAAMPDSPYRARKYVRRGVLSRGDDGADENEEEGHGGAFGREEEEDGEDDDPYHHTLASILDIVHEERGAGIGIGAAAGAGAGDLSHPEIDFSSQETLLAAVEENGSKLEELRTAQEIVNESLLASVADLQQKCAALLEDNAQLHRKQVSMNIVMEAARTKEIEAQENVLIDHVSTELQLVIISVFVLLIVYNAVYWFGSSASDTTGF